MDDDDLLFRLSTLAREACVDGDALHDAIRMYVNQDEPPLGDLVRRWDEASSDLDRLGLLNTYELHSFRRRWAWDGLSELLATLKKRREPIPDPVKDWACDVALRLHDGTLKIPDRLRNQHFAPKDERDLRIKSIYIRLHDAGWTKNRCEEAIMSALDDIDDDTIRSIFRKLKLRVLYTVDAR